MDGRVGNAAQAQRYPRRPAWNLLEAEARPRAEALARRVAAVPVDQPCRHAGRIAFAARSPSQRKVVIGVGAAVGDRRHDLVAAGVVSGAENVGAKRRTRREQSKKETACA
jgi:hypothetical protein